MKKIAIVFSALILILTSCSSDDESNSNQNLILLKKSISTSSSGAVNTINYAYEGNKIISATSNSSKINYFYTGNLITKIEVTNLDEVVTDRFLYVYDSLQRLIQKSSLSITTNNGAREILQYNSDSSISFNDYSGDLISQTELFGTGKYFFNGNNKIKEEYTFANDNQTVIRTFEYDDKNSPFKNVLNMIYFLNFTSNNFNIVFSVTKINGEIQSTGISQYSYNSNNFPITESTTSTNGTFPTTVTTQYFY